MFTVLVNIRFLLRGVHAHIAQVSIMYDHEYTSSELCALVAPGPQPELREQADRASPGPQSATGRSTSNRASAGTALPQMPAQLQGCRRQGRVRLPAGPLPRRRLHQRQHRTRRLLPPHHLRRRLAGPHRRLPKQPCEQSCPDNNVCRVQKQGCVAVKAYSKHWPCLFPSTAPARNTSAPSPSNPGSRQIVDAHPWEFIRGLIHSDGCRITNWTTRIVGGEHKRYEYPRYFFTNKSDDIRTLFTDTLDRVGVEWTTSPRQRPVNISVARKASVALMDTHMGPKY